MKKFLLVLSAILIANLFSVAALAADVPTLYNPFGDTPPTLEPSDDNLSVPSLQPETTSGTSGGGSSGGSRRSTTTTTSNPAPAPIGTLVPADDDREISETGPEMIYLIILGLLLIGGYQFAMKKK